MLFLCPTILSEAEFKSNKLTNLADISRQSASGMVAGCFLKGLNFPIFTNKPRFQVSERGKQVSLPTKGHL